MKTVKVFLLGINTIFIIVQAGHSEKLNGAKRPKYSPVLRQNENWAGLAEYGTAESSDFFDPVKYTSLSENGKFISETGSDDAIDFAYLSVQVTF